MRITRWSNPAETLFSNPSNERTGVRECAVYRTLLAITFAALTLWTTSAPAADEFPSDHEIIIPALSLRVPKAEIVSFAALANDDTVEGKPGSMLYAGPLVVAFAELAVHGVYESNQQAKERKAKNSLSDIVLAPYQPALSHFTNADLMGRALEGLATHGDKVLIQFTARAGPGWLIESSPTFFMTQDARALVLQNSIVVHSPDAASPATFNSVVEVVGSPREAVGRDSENSWMIEDGARLQSASVVLLRESVSLALSEIHGDFAAHAAAFHTVRYPRGGSEKMERAQILRETPRRLVLKTLRGWIMSVPVAAEEADLPDATASRAPIRD
jgi:hypothetical protein